MSVFDLPADGFDRRKPLFRVFNIDGETQWWTVIAALNAPGRRCTPEEEARIVERLQAQPWADKFWTCYHLSGKATIYESTPE
ncbi:hypothetical protein HOT99_gp049 [Caulobacter phage CcrBL10]|uniref:Uncharacterized protein n=1 Tax=Caulobacter phage CcrBL10 TaxID=2283269 RepID=A0A385E8W8_9CAUD|nr:hypothetical protein HOT99_gp049 [Caulobacter phage CcrBL10]AXQ68253.1 hypothetical protein CcrBL10_gp049 [Caulobacter phage CcrBL10]